MGALKKKKKKKKIEKQFFVRVLTFQLNGYKPPNADDFSENCHSGPISLAKSEKPFE